MEKPVKFSYCFSSDDVSAIIAALPLVPAFRADTEIQQHINETLCLSAMDKLARGDTNLIPNELRVVALSVCFAKDFLAGHLDLDVDPETLSEIRPRIFTYNRLDVVFGPLLDQIDEYLNS